MYIRNTTQRKFSDAIKTSNTSSTSNIDGVADIADISELKSKEQANTFETISVNIKNTNSANINSRSSKRSGASRVIEYLSNKKYYVLAISFIYVIGVILGSILIKNIDKREIINLCSAMDSYFTGISSIDMTARILGNIMLNMIFIFGIYICGITVFSPLVCSAFCLYKGLTCGFIMGIYIMGNSDKFHLAVCVLNFILYLFIMIFYILTCGESMSFSTFLFKNEESFKNSLSFKNVSVYSSRFLLFLVLISLSTVVQTLIIPLVYSIAG